MEERKKRKMRARAHGLSPRFSTRSAFLRRSLERKSLRRVFVAGQKNYVRRLSASNHISALNDAITLAAGDPKDS